MPKQKFPSPLSFVAVLAVLLLVAQEAVIVRADESDSNNFLNVYGETLQPCSSDGMALTGYTRSGYCVDRSDDSGSHHVCIDLSSLGGSGGDNDNQNFCDVTGQSDWCSSEDMPCHEDYTTSACPVTNWCVCQWAFASYIQGSGGCENIQSVVCESINQQALWAYQKMASQRNADTKYQDALDCLVNRCGLDSSHLARTTNSLFSTTANGATRGTTTLVMAAVAILVGAAVYYFYPKRGAMLASKASIDLNRDDGAIGATPASSGSKSLL